MPFFAQLWAAGKRYDFAVGVADAVSRVVALGLLAASAMVALAVPIVGLVFGGGRFTPADVSLTALFFALYTVSLFAWSAQAIYARAFYAAGITWLPMLASTVILVVAFPLYGIGYRLTGAAGLALASDAGLLLQTIALALLLHSKRMVSLASLDYREIGRCFVVACISGVVVWFIFSRLARYALHALAHNPGRWTDAVLLALGSLAWLAISDVVLTRLGSALPRVLRKRLKLAA